MKTFKFKTQILIICCALIAYGDSALETRIGSDGREYLIDGDNKYTWFQARDECAGRNQQLLTIDSAEKQNVINKLLEDKTGWLWLGANNKLNFSGIADPPFFWSATGKQFTYANWAANFPNKADNQNCVVIFIGLKEWMNIWCKDKNGFICEEKPKQSVESFINEIDLKFQRLLKEYMAELNGRLESIEQVGKDTNDEVEKLTNITQKIRNKQELSTKEVNLEIAKQGSDLSDQLKRSVDELNTKFSERQNFTYHPKNIVLIKQTG